ncbi:Scr1 family TA system antitoxin-like transcriptional regulator [Actinokineospora enzanensis]|uniref:Scr1 family TA system antitoxin-like transcriptional regulator n=1 Tax=Actinokineospora enzanensis TaxID=155975 RepID=UPI00035CAC24|nr:Scr1 family TA system antitoxin-like transcriptional regulator [Actinokineospora enzanensis]
MAKGTATMPRVFLGVALHQLRVEAGISLEAAAKHIGKSRQRLMNLIEGRATLTADELKSLAEYLGAAGDRLSELEALGAEARRSPTGDPYTDLGPESWRRVAYLEAKARTIQAYENGVFPALIQCHEYLTAMTEASEGIWLDPMDGETRAKRVAARLERQRYVFEAAESKRVQVFFTEDTFNALVGNKEVMRAQCAHIMDLALVHANLDIRIIPSPVWDNPAQYCGLALFGFGDLLRPVGFLAVVYGPSAYLDKEEDTVRIARAFERLEELALSRDETLKLIEVKKEGFSR